MTAVLHFAMAMRAFVVGRPRLGRRRFSTTPDVSPETIVLVVTVVAIVMPKAAILHGLGQTPGERAAARAACAVCDVAARGSVSHGTSSMVAALLVNTLSSRQSVVLKFLFSWLASAVSESWGGGRWR